MNLRKYRLGRAVILAAVFIFGFDTLAAAQSNATDAAVEGYVRDASGGVVSGANVTAKNTATNIVNQTTTDGAGYYRFPFRVRCR